MYPPVELPADHVDRAEGRDDVGDRVADEQHGQCRHDGEARRPHTHPVGVAGAVAHHVEAQFAVGPLHGLIDLAFGRPNPMAEHDQLELLHEPLDVAVCVLLGRQESPLLVGCDERVALEPRAFERRPRDRTAAREGTDITHLGEVHHPRCWNRVARTRVDHDRTGRKVVQGGLDDAHRLLHLFDAHEEAIHVVARGADRHVEVDAVVHQVRAVLAHVVVASAGAQKGAGDAVRDGVLGGDHAGALHAVREDTVANEERLRFGDDLPGLRERLGAGLSESIRQVGLHAADAAVADRQAGAGHHLHEVPEILARLDHVEEDREGSELHRARAEAGEMIRDARDLRDDHPHVLAALGDRDPEQFLHRHAVADVVDERGHVVEPIRVRHDAVVVDFFRHLLEGAVQVADLDIDFFDLLAIELGDEADDAVHRGMGRADVEEHVPGLEFRRIALGRRCRVGSRLGGRRHG